MPVQVTSHPELIIWLVIFVFIGFAILVGGSHWIYSRYYTEIQAQTPPTVIQPIQTAPPPPPAAPGAVPGGTNLSNPVSASLTQLTQIAQTTNAATNIPSPATNADIETILNYLIARGGRLDGSVWGAEALRVLKNRTPWVCGGTGSLTTCTYPAGVDTQTSWMIFYDDSTGKWNLRAIT